MPQEPNTALRLLVPAIAIGLGALIIVAVGGRRGPKPGSVRAPAGVVAPTGKDAATQPGESRDAAKSVSDANPAEPTPPPEQTNPAETQVENPVEKPDAKVAATTAPVAGGLTAGPVEQPTTDAPALHVALVDPPASGDFGAIGSDDPKSDYQLRVEFTPEGAGVGAITLAKHFQSEFRKKHYAVQERQAVSFAAGAQVTVASLAARLVEINGSRVDLFSSGRSDKWVWRQASRTADEAQFVANIVDEKGAPVARIEREYSVVGGSFNIDVRQRVVNLTADPMTVRWVQYGAVDLPAGDLGYGGDKRRVRFGALLDPALDPSRQIVRSVGSLGARRTIVGKAPAPRSKQIYPAPGQQNQGRELVWAAMTSRYFTFAVHSLPPKGVDPTQVWDKRLPIGAEVDRVLAGPPDASGVVLLEHHSDAVTIDAGASLGLDFGAYAGPLWRKTLGGEPLFTSIGLNDLVVYNFGGPCSFFTFQPLARGLLWFLGAAHDLIFHDWALAIMFLVLCVRGVLHPVTKRAQINMQRFSKQMQSLAPKQKKLQEKYADDQKRLREEMATLMKEQGVNPAMALGCLPMFLQTPVWIALYAMLFFAFDLRHQPAFFGVFQAVSGGNWAFLGDLSHPDRIVYFGKSLVTLPLLGPIDSLNALPLLLGLVFYGQQKYLTPPPSTAPTPEQQNQQKIMRVLMVVMFPLIMYSAPSGLAIYFITNSTLGILESRHIRAHITQMDLSPKKSDGDDGAPDAGARRKMRKASNPFDKRWRDEGKSPYKQRRKRSR